MSEVTCPQCGSANVTEAPIPGGTHYTCLDCGYEWNVAGPPPRFLLLELLTEAFMIGSAILVMTVITGKSS